MNVEPSNVLDYARPPERPRRSFALAPRHFAWAAFFMAGLTLIQPLDVGSGRIIINPLRGLCCGLSVAAVLMYAFLRLWQDRARGLVRAAVLGTAMLVSTALFVLAQWEVWGGVRLPPMSLQYDYWRTILAFGLCPVVAVAVVLALGVANRLAKGLAQRPAG